MERPRATTTNADLLEHSAMTTAAVAADLEVAGLEQGLKQAHIELKKCVRAVEDKDEDVQAKRRVFFLRDIACDRVVKSFELALYGGVDKHRDHPLYKRYFKEGLRAVTEAEPRHSEPALVKEMLAAMAADAGKPLIGPLVAQFSPMLQAALDQVELTEKIYAAAETELKFLEDMVLGEARSGWEDEYVKLHGALKIALPRDAERVEGFFAPFRKAPKKQVADETTDEAPANGSATPAAGIPAGGTAPPPAAGGGSPVN